LEAFEKISLWSKETGLNPDDILLAQTEEGFNVLQFAAD